MNAKRTDMTRRRFFGHAGGLVGLALGGDLPGIFAEDARGKAKRCVVLWMNGGPSQIDTFDPKPGRDTGGPFKAIETAAKGVQVSEHFPQVARRMDKLSVVRSIHSTIGAHGRANYYMHVGYPEQKGFPRASAGAVLSHESPRARIPKHVTIGAQGFGPAYLGPDHAPFGLDDPKSALEMFRRIERSAKSLTLAQKLGAPFEEAHASALLDRRRAVQRRIREMLDTPFVAALDLDREPARVRERYGSEEFGRGCLLARRLLEIGVRYVEVGLDGWDTHKANFDRVRELSTTLDRPWAALMDDLDARGLLDETVVMWMGEFGRTPNVNGSDGRDHYPGASSVVIGGGGIAGGRVVGRTDERGYTIVDRPVSVPDLFATLYAAHGIAPDRNYTNRFGAKATATDQGEVVRELL